MPGTLHQLLHKYQADYRELDKLLGRKRSLANRLGTIVKDVKHWQDGLRQAKVELADVLAHSGGMRGMLRARYKARQWQLQERVIHSCMEPWYGCMQADIGRLEPPLAERKQLLKEGRCAGWRVHHLPCLPDLPAPCCPAAAVEYLDAIRATVPRGRQRLCLRTNNDVAYLAYTLTQATCMLVRLGFADSSQAFVQVRFYADAKRKKGSKPSKSAYRVAKVLLESGLAGGRSRQALVDLLMAGRGVPLDEDEVLGFLEDLCNA